MEGRRPRVHADQPPRRAIEIPAAPQCRFHVDHFAGYRSNLDVHVLPAFGRYQLGRIDRMSVEEWVADLQASGLGPSGIRQARQVLSNMLTLAVDTGHLSSNPVERVHTPRQPQPQMLFLCAEQVDRLAATIRQPYGALVYLLAYGGLRWGEAAALSRQRSQ